MPPMTRHAIAPDARRVDDAQFASMVRAHEDFLKGRSVAGRIIPRHIVAHGMRCDRRRLTDIDFTGADLTGSTFVGSDLTRASLHCATLARCTFRHAVMRRADLRGAACAGADFGGAVLEEADMRAAILVAADVVRGIRRIGAQADMRGAGLDGSSLEDLQAYGVDFTNCSLQGAKLRNANLKNAVFQDANLDGADLFGARMEGVRLQGAVLTGVDLTRLNLPPDLLVGCVLDVSPDALSLADEIRRIVDAAEAWVRSVGRSGASGRLDGLDVRAAPEAFRERRLAGLSAKGVTAVGVDFSGAELQGAAFDGADLRKANFTGADLRGASFVNAKLGHATLSQADLGALHLGDGRAHPVRFDGAVLVGTGVRGAIGTPPAGADPGLDGAGR